MTLLALALPPPSVPGLLAGEAVATVRARLLELMVAELLGKEEPVRSCVGLLLLALLALSDPWLLAEEA